MGLVAAPSQVEDLVFDPKVHLNYTPPSTVYTVEDLHLERRAHSTPIAATAPFPLLSEAGVRAYRTALFDQDVVQNCAIRAFPHTMLLRNAASRSKFLHDFWNHPKVLQILSDNIQAPLTPVMQLEEAFVSTQTDSDTIEEMKKEPRIEPYHEKVELTGAQRNYDPLAADSLIPWHYDSYPYACILMLSHTEHMVGGETYIKRGDGKIEKIAGPTFGCAYVIQGNMLEHIASRAVGVKERIAAVTAFRCNAPGYYDNSYLTNVRPFTEPTQLYREWTDYRLELMKNEIDRMQRKVRKSTHPIDVQEFQRFADEHEAYMNRTANQMMSPDYIKTILKCFGEPAYHSVKPDWKRIQAHPQYPEMIAKVNQTTWAPTAGYEAQLLLARAALQRGETLQGQTGPFTWVRPYEYSMGDELIRGGHREVFLDWANHYGLYKLLTDLPTTVIDDAWPWWTPFSTLLVTLHSLSARAWLLLKGHT